MKRLTDVEYKMIKQVEEITGRVYDTVYVKDEYYIGVDDLISIIEDLKVEYDLIIEENEE